jgi:molecular chaperone DnaK (HSP70)
VRFALDLNGILQVSAQEKETGLEKSIRIDNAISRFQEEQLQTARERINALFREDVEGTGTVIEGEASDVKTGSAQQHIVVQARALVEKAERMLDQAPEEDREDLINLIELIRDHLTGENYGELQSVMDELSDILFYLES